jgi:hypothetical protein
MGFPATALTLKAIPAISIPSAGIVDIFADTKLESILFFIVFHFVLF